MGRHLRVAKAVMMCGAVGGGSHSTRHAAGRPAVTPPVARKGLGSAPPTGGPPAIPALPLSQQPEEARGPVRPGRDPRPHGPDRPLRPRQGPRAARDAKRGLQLRQAPPARRGPQRTLSGGSTPMRTGRPTGAAETAPSPAPPSAAACRSVLARAFRRRRTAGPRPAARCRPVQVPCPLRPCITGRTAPRRAGRVSPGPPARRRLRAPSRARLP